MNLFRVAILAAVYSSRYTAAFAPHLIGRKIKFQTCKSSLMPIDELADDDLVAVPFDDYIALSSEEETKFQLRLCVVRNQNCIYPLIRHEDDVETDLFLDPRHVEKQILLQDILRWWTENDQLKLDEGDNDTKDSINELQYYGVGWYGQRPVPSLGGGPGYGAEADEIWSIDESVLEQLLDEDGVDVPIIDVGMAHGEKARGGALF